ncbi:hypothetical protein HYV64_04580 [Candidatus Shapirobacteria bacterium]|nr:hypothetical protein [Candidatus Shapirobacteria bacterium]
MNKLGIIGDTLEVLQEEAKRGVKTAASQITGRQPKNKQPKAPKEGEDKKDFVQDLYGGNVKPLTNEQVAKKEMEDKQKEETLRQKLHGEYYQKLISPQKRPQEAQEGQERAAERVERLGMEDLQKKKEDEEKKKPIAVAQAERKTEAPLGAG